MANPWETDNCAHLRAHSAVYSIPKAAALWCGVPGDMLNTVLNEVQPLSETGLGRSIWTHPAVPCLEPRSRAIAEAIEIGELPHGREDGHQFQREVGLQIVKKMIASCDARGSDAAP